MKQGATDKGKMCHIQPETVKHIIRMPNTRCRKYFNGHNQMAAQLYMEICNHYEWMHNIGINTIQKWVTENDEVVVIRDSQITTDRDIPCNKPDIVIRE